MSDVTTATDTDPVDPEVSEDDQMAQLIAAALFQQGVQMFLQNQRMIAEAKKTNPGG